MHEIEVLPDGEPQEITAVELLQRPRGRYRIYFGDPFVTVHESTMVRYGMTKGSFFNKTSLREIISDNERQIAYAEALNYLSFRPRTSGEVEKRLLEKEIDPHAAAAVVQRLASENLIDDQLYAKEWARQRVTNRKKGKVWVRQELKQKGIDQELIQEALDEVGDEDELSSAVDTASKKWRTTKGEVWERKRKTLAFLMRRGFSSDISRKALEAVLQSDGADADDLGTEFD
ncbi:RecX family transcriptional regulator [Saccharibacillus sp. CPCC 101409]|uniref:regulatory protein RecX n=1 Tax=Saccharibacillus sp. CPCC 101409 TaxID=3058041 RepID=UPI002673B490|nr:RecX family transcriptional regulator [Saccharibacillus sp. CPCC 101409]MDO3410633.1 RecX family transcriptional regulator [Saccharibacillus sp. CPCC 101409]